jgi:phosphate transporter
VLKKYDKTLDRNLKKRYIKDNVEAQYTFKQETMDKISNKISQIEQLYANLNTQGNIDQAKRELRLDLREHVVWERNTVWRDMIGIERKAQAANLGVRRTILGDEGDHKQGDDGENAPMTKEVETPIGRYTLPKFLLQPTLWYLVVIFTIFMVLLYVPILELPEQQNCLAMVVFVSLLWATEVRYHDNIPIVIKLMQHTGNTTFCYIPYSPFSGRPSPHS